MQQDRVCRAANLGDRRSQHTLLPFLPYKVGSGWNSAAQIDVAGIISLEKTQMIIPLSAPGQRRLAERFDFRRSQAEGESPSIVNGLFAILRPRDR